MQKIVNLEMPDRTLLLESIGVPGYFLVAQLSAREMEKCGKAKFSIGTLVKIKDGCEGCIIPICIDNKIHHITREDFIKLTEFALDDENNLKTLKKQVALLQDIIWERYQ